MRVILPESYEAGSATRYPVLYLLHGAGDSYRTWVENTDIVAFSSGHETIIVMPDGGDSPDSGWYSDWVDESRDWESFHIDVLIDYVDATFSTLGDGHRAVACLSADEAGVPVHEDLYLGGYHGWPYWEREALPQIVAAID